MCGYRPQRGAVHTLRVQLKLLEEKVEKGNET